MSFESRERTAPISFMAWKSFVFNGLRIIRLMFRDVIDVHCQHEGPV